MHFCSLATPHLSAAIKPKMNSLATQTEETKTSSQLQDNQTESLRFPTTEEAVRDLY